MAVTASGLYLATFADILDVTQLAIDFDAETHRYALFSNVITPNFSTDTAYGVAPYATNEVSGTNWPAGGVLLAGTTLLVVGTAVVWDANDIVVANATFTGARLGLIYADAAVGNNAIVGQNLVTDQSPSAGTFTVQFSANGILRFVNP